MNTSQPWRDVTISSDDGLTLYARDYGPLNSKLVPVLFLAGLTRNSADFDALARRLSKTRRVLAPDYRGRGRSQNAADPQTYQPDVEMADAVKLLDYCHIRKFAVIGTSRGGLIAMIMGAVMPERLCGIVLNDIGPKIEDAGLLRIVDYLGVDPGYADWSEAAQALRQSHTDFSGLGDADWLAYAKRLYREENDRPVLNYDPQIKVTFPDRAFIESGKIPQAWDLFDKLAGLPVAIIRGANSDLLSAATVDEMKRRHPGLIVSTVPGRGHVPFLDEPEAVQAIEQLLEKADRHCRA